MQPFFTKRVSAFVCHICSLTSELGFDSGTLLGLSGRKIPPNTCVLRYSSNPVLLCCPATPTGCGLSQPWSSTVDNWRRKTEEFLQQSQNHLRPQLCVFVIKTTTGSVPDRKISIRACVCLFFEICVLASTRSVLFLKVTRCHIVVSVRDFLSALC